MKELKIKTSSMEETQKLGTTLGSLAEPNMVYLLDGDLGAGKTTLTQGIARGLGVNRNVTSPTFNILKIYQGRMTLYHIDAYRLEGLHQELGFEEFLDDDGLTVIEWSQYVPELVPEEHLFISIRLLEGDIREFTLTADGAVYEKLLEELK
ncbi:MAG: tRNA (adenosine(37)-N6)-threonylcarbamoyltransferase complex ATPase subunit type 1 TsaE [Solobacterium sp.]|jgi:tRNA threonylcarbamoyladenosine biosynthesis protein TsaE|nr:tRNA (adenosine(37)-N6)-threonylcarbamoyltransferase complex ATPase subunit type 1 TsaE [Solobacterium sp.]MCH4266486.1 tRNA (adenosine(37)-N6)-threonylcarbamoyltransferase complex ATPase subunit type 1 TsaE [Solobacterium sp.]